MQEEEKVIRFRNYAPKDKTLWKYCLNPPIDTRKEKRTRDKQVEKDEEKEGRTDREEEEDDEEDEAETINEGGHRPTKKARTQAESAPSSGSSGNNHNPTSSRELIEKYGVLNQNIIAEELAKYQSPDEHNRYVTRDAQGTINLVPRKINWDLKQQLQPKLDKLKKKTQKAIVELLREKFAKEGEES